MLQRTLILPAVLILAACAWAGDKSTPKPPAVAPPQAGSVKGPVKPDKGPDKSAAKLQVTVVSITGQAEKFAAGRGDKWTPVKAGDKLDEMSIIRTGLRSQVVLRFEDRGRTIVGAGTKVGIARFSKQNNLVTTRLGLKYGSLNMAVDSTRGPNDAAVVTPVATLSVRGTKGEIGYAGGRHLMLCGRAGTWQVTGSGRSRHVAAGESTDGNLTPSMILAKNRRGSFRALMGVTPAERTNIIEHPHPLDPTGTGDTPPGSGRRSTGLSPGVPGDHIVIGT